MQVKTFTDESLPKALFKAKQELGNDIVIIESKEIRNYSGNPGVRMVEVTVGHNPKKKIKKWIPPRVDENGADMSEKPKPKKSFSEIAAAYGRPAAPQPQARPAKKQTEAKADNNSFDSMISDILNRKPKELDKEKVILDEIASLRAEIKQLSEKTEKKNTPAPGPKVEKIAAPASLYNEYPEPYASIQEQLRESGVQDDLAYALVNQAFLLNEGRRDVSKKQVRAQIEKELRAMMQTYNFKSRNRRSKQRVVLLLGPTGAGKSTAAMKLAAHPGMFGNKKTTILSTDPYGPSEALKAFARMHETDVYEEKDIDQTATILEKYKKSDVIIVDTPGKSPFAPNQLEKWEQYIKILKPTDIFLVMSVGADLKDLVLLCANYLLVKPTGIIFTKFDETTQPGKVFSILDVISLPVVAFGDGKRIFVDTREGKPEYMFNKIFGAQTEEA